MAGRHLGKVVLASTAAGIAVFTFFALFGWTGVAFQVVAVAACYLVMAVGIVRMPEKERPQGR